MMILKMIMNNVNVAKHEYTPRSEKLMRCNIADVEFRA